MTILYRITVPPRLVRPLAASFLLKHRFHFYSYVGGRQECLLPRLKIRRE
jgi:hypothetical protein